jgi:hypothetical protein
MKSQISLISFCWMVDNMSYFLNNGKSTRLPMIIVLGVLDMATVQLNVEDSSALTELSNSGNSISLWRRPRQMSVAVLTLNRLWWHTKAYGTILGLMQLVLLSLVLVYLNWLYRKFSPIKRSTKSLNIDSKPPAATF